MLKTEKIIYHDGEVELEGYYACKSDEADQKRPVILVAHDWSGRNAFACQKAELLAKLGYIGFAIDMYGRGKLGNNREENSALMQPFMQDRQKLQQRILAAYETALQLKESNQTVGAIGFCFGGLCVLDLARSGAAVKGVVSFHGLLQPPGLPKQKITSKVLVLHGYDDPMATPDSVLAFTHEMTAQQVDWQIDMYGNTMHAFTNPNADDKNFGTVYQPLVAKRAFVAMEYFFQEVFA
jgi:dienelactone hydrolase